jgi:hypothetical protein
MADELTALRFALMQARREFEESRRAVTNLQVVIDSVHESDLDSGTLSTERLTELQAALDAAKGPAAVAAGALDSARAAYDAAAAAQPPLFEHDNGLPLLLLPVRIETVYRDVGPGRELWIRVYPDDAHVDAHEPALTIAERDALARYRDAVAAAAANEKLRDAAWRALVAKVGPARANWVLEAPPDAEPAPEQSWTRAAHTTMLPDRFVFTAYTETGLAWRHEGNDLPDTLPVAFAPQGEGVDGLPWDESSRWLVDFEKAVELGLGIKVPLAAGAESFSLLTVVGVSAKQDGATGAARWQATLSAHRFTNDLAVLPIGTPTNNTPATRSGWRSHPEAVPPEEIDRRRAQFDGTSDQPGACAARAFGIDGRSDLAVAADALADDEAALLEVQRALADFYALSAVWKPLTVTLISPELLPRMDVGFAIDHFMAHVRSRGVLPTLRIGRQPYGVLPASSPDLWRGGDVDARIVAHVKSFHHSFEERVAQLPRVESEGDPQDQDSVIMDLLSRQPTAPQVRVWFQGEHAWRGMETTPSAGSVPADSLFGRLTQPDESSVTTWETGPTPSNDTRRLVERRPLGQVLGVVSELYDGIDAHDFSQAPFAFEEFDARQQEADAAVQAITYATSVPGVEAPGAVFYSHAGFVGEWAYKMGQDHAVQLSNPDPATPPELPGAFAHERARVKAALAQLVALEDRAVADLALLDRLVVEVLETLSHRVDSWVTSLAAARLAAMRTAQPTGLSTGAYGWLTDVRPGDELPSDGYVVTPSLQHAATAAVLRSGYRAHSDERALAVDLQSRRVRRALPVVEAVRAGQTLDALLGYQLERGLHDAEMDHLIAGLRASYPLAPLVEPEGPASEQARVAIGARNVVDGQGIRGDGEARTDPAVLAARARVEALTEDEATTLLGLIDDLDDTVDAVGDLLLSESVHHLVGGTPLRAGLAADVVGRAEDLPTDFEVVHTPRGAATVTHTVGILGAATGSPAPGWSDSRPLAALEPALEAWCRTRLGPAGAWRFACEGRDAAGEVVPAGEVSLDQLGWCALDVLAATAMSAGTDSPLGRALLAQHGPATELAPDGAARAAELELVSGQLRALFVAGTPLLATHLDPQESDPWAQADLADLHRRLGAWLGQVDGARADLRVALAALSGAPADADATDLRVAIRPPLDRLVELGVTAAVTTGDADLPMLGARVLAALDALEPPQPPDAPPPPEEAGPVIPALAIAAPPPADAGAAERRAWAEAALDLADRLLADGLTVVPVLGTGPLAPPPPGAEPVAVADWVRGVVPVRARVQALDDALVTATVLADADEGELHVVQTPAPEQGTTVPWVATGVPDGDLVARASVALHHDGAAQGPTIGGLVVDTWSEGIPRRGAPPQTDAPAPDGTPLPTRGRVEGPEEIAGVTFNHDRPGARAPQAMLLAVPPDPARGWRLEDVHAVVEDTLRLAQIRGLDLDDVPDLRTSIPIPTPDNL